MLAMTKITTCTNLPDRLVTTASNDKKLYEGPVLTTFEAGPGLDDRSNHIQSVVAVGPFVDDTISVR